MLGNVTIAVVIQAAVFLLFMLVVGKSDLDPKLAETLSEEYRLAEVPVIAVSARTGEGLDELRRLLAERVAALAPTDESGDADALAEALGTLTRMPSPEEDLVLAANTMRQASERLGAMIGAAYSADLLDRLFSRFCVGK